MKKLTILFAALTLSVGVWAIDGVKYIDADGVEQTANNVTEINSDIYDWGTAGQATWYVVTGTDVQILNGAICAGDVRLILADNAKLTATGGINVTETNSLTIYAQSTGTQMGQLIAHGGYYGAGIGGGEYASGSNITINGGIVTATGGEFGAGIGGGYYSAGYNITINGGKVKATGVGGAAGIGGGYYGGFGSDIYISDAYVLKAGAAVDPKEVIDHSSATDLASTLTQQYVTIKGLAMPYTRTTTIDQWATVCLPYDATSFSGADFYKVNYYDASNPSDLKLYIEPVDNLVAGMPYIFQATADVVTIYHNATAPEAVTAGNENGLYGSFARKTIAYDAEHAFAALANNTVNVIASENEITIPACRAYLDMNKVPTEEQPHTAPLRVMGVPRSTPTNNENVNADGNMNGKFIINGQFVIVKDGKKINALGF